MTPGAPTGPIGERAESRARVLAVTGDVVHARDDHCAGEEPLEIRAAGPDQDAVSVAVTMRTPGDEEDLAAGFLYTEGLIAPDEIVGFEYGDPLAHSYPENVLLVRLSRPFDPQRVATRNFVATASCGICGKTSLDQVEVRCAPIPPGPVVTRRTLVRLPDALHAAQALFASTGGLHASGLFTAGGDPLSVREDIGRHNALDKLVGQGVRERRVPFTDRIVLVSGRVAFEIVQKAAMAGVPILCAVGAPSDLAVRAADRLGITLVGFLRGDAFNVYSHPERIDRLEPAEVRGRS